MQDNHGIYHSHLVEPYKIQQLKHGKEKMKILQLLKKH